MVSQSSCVVYLILGVYIKIMLIQLAKWIKINKCFIKLISLIVNHSHKFYPSVQLEVYLLILYAGTER